MKDNKVDDFKEKEDLESNIQSPEGAEAYEEHEEEITEDVNDEEENIVEKAKHKAKEKRRIGE